MTRGRTRTVPGQGQGPVVPVQLREAGYDIVPRSRLMEGIYWGASRSSSRGHMYDEPSSSSRCSSRRGDLVLRAGQG